MARPGELPPLTTEELACIYSAAILADDDIPVTQEKLSTILKAADVDVEPIWPMLYARALQGVNIRELITNIGTCSVGPSGGAAAGSGAAAAATGGGSGEAEAEKPKEPDSDSESDDDMGFGLFD